ncbi:MAG: DUF4011 domain-containing protein, partial [Bacilli bacterium]|nr:DUF4011 domain-containing protein [Bacilli bacterium]
MAELLSLKKCRDKLLDLGKRNRLLFFSYGASALPILSPEKEKLYGDLRSGKKVAIFDLDSYFEAIKKPFHFFLDEECTHDDRQAALASARSDQLVLYSVSARKKLSQSLRLLKNTADDAFANRGIQILYLSFGLLKWKDKDENDMIVSSPLVMMPVYLVKNENGQYSIYADEGSEAFVNGTLQYQLKGMYGFIFPTFKEGETLEEYFAAVSAKCENLGWSLSDECSIGLFSFAKIDMFSDLQNNEDTIVANEHVARLFDAGGNEAAEPLPNEVDEKVEEALRKGSIHLHNVVDADSSQLRAIAAAKEGHSFVLQGPPGTGKSQTITNIIAEALYEGKNVLFVSEKMAALEVVYNKLSAVGLGDFCLRLHGHKANKKSVVEDIDHSMNLLQNIRLTNGAEEALSALEKETEALNSYEEALHSQVKEFEVTPFELYAEMDRLDGVKAPLFSFDNIEACGKEFLVEAMTNFDTIREGIAIMGNHYSEYCLYGYNAPDTFQDEMRFTAALEAAKKDVDLLKEGLDPLVDSLKVDSAFKAHQLPRLFDFLRYFKSSSFYEPSLFDAHRDVLSEIVKEAIETEERMNGFHDEVLSSFTEDIFSDIKAEAIAGRYAKKFKNIFRGFMPQYHRDTKQLRLYARDDALPFKKTREAMLSFLSYQKDKRHLEELRKELGDSFDNKRNADERRFSAFLSKVKGYLPFVSLDLRPLVSLREKDWAEIKKKIDLTNLNVDYLNEILELQSFFDETKKDLTRFSFSALRKFVYDAGEEKTHLHLNVRFVEAMEKAHEQGYGAFVEEYLASDLSVENLSAAFKKVLTQQRIDYVERKRSILSTLTRQHHDELVEKFQRDDKLRFAIAQAQVKKAVLSRFPSSTGKGVYAKLAYEASKKRNVRPVRQLMDLYQAQIQTFKPCFMMSPLSVSTFLKPNYRFDLVVFDEASQVYPWDAIGAIYRANQVIVVGDNKQMPPTNFFQSVDALEDNYDEDLDVSDVGDFESILDFFMNFPHYRLLWHYRSRNEALIDFSNRYFYDGSLITFPSSQKAVPGFGVDFVFAKGTYNRGSHFNPIEAKAAAKVVYESVTKHPERSIGVVAFN